MKNRKKKTIQPKTIEQRFVESQKVFFLRMEEEHAKKGTITCDCYLCDCLTRKELLANKMHIFVHPDGKKIDSICEHGLQLVSKIHNIQLESMK